MKYVILFLWCGFFLSDQAHCQTEKADSLRILFASASEDTTKWNILSDIVEVSYQNDWDYTMEVLDTSLIIAKRTGDPIRIGGTHGWIGYMHMVKGDWEEAIISNDKALRFRLKGKKWESIPGSHTNLAISYAYAEQNDSAIFHYEKAAQTALGLNDTTTYKLLINSMITFYNKLGKQEKVIIIGLETLKIIEDDIYAKDQSSMHNQVALAYSFLDKHENAIEHGYKSLRIAESVEFDTLGMSSNYSNFGIILERADILDSALIYYTKALRLTPKSSSVLNNVGTVYYNLKDYDKSLSYLEASIKGKKSQSVGHSNSQIYANLGHIYATKGQFKKAEKNLNIALELSANNTFSMSRLSIYGSLVLLYEKTNRFKEAFEFERKLRILKDTLRKKDENKILLEMEAKYEAEKKEQSIALLTSTNALSEQRALQEKTKRETEEIKGRQKDMVAYSLLGGLGLLLLITALLYRGMQRKKKDNLIIQEQNQLVESQKKEVELKNIIVEKHNKEILDSINYAKRLQDAILPPKSEFEKWLPESFILYKPKDIVAGDFYWMEVIKEDTNTDLVFFAAADCTGHGVPGALVSVVCHNALNRAVNEFHLYNPGEILDKVRALVIETFEKSEGEVRDGMDIALCCINKTSGELKFSGANNPLWIHRHQLSEIEVVKGDKQPIGIHGSLTSFNTHVVTLNPKDTIYLFSDGYYDQFGGEIGKKLKSSNFKKILLEISGKQPSAQCIELDKAFENWRGEFEQLDDVCVIGVQF